MATGSESGLARPRQPVATSPATEVDRGTCAQSVLAAARDSLTELSIIVVDRDFRILDLQGTHLLGLPSFDNAAGEPLSEVLPDLWRAAGAVFRGAIEGSPRTVDYRLGGTGVTLAVMGSPVLAGGHIVGATIVIRNVSAERKTQEELAATARQFKAMAETSLDGNCLYDPGGTLRWASPSMESLTGKDMIDLVGSRVETVIHPEDLPRRDAAFADMVRTRQPHTIELRRQHGDGTWRWFASTVRGRFDDAGGLLEVHVTTRDITQQRADEELRRELRAREQSERAAVQRFEQAFTQAPIGMCLVGLDGTLLQVNAAACRLWERDEHDLLTATFQELTHPDDLDADLELLQETLDGQRDHYQMRKRYLTPAGRVIPAWLCVSLIRNPDSTPAHFVSQIVDLTQARAAEQQIRILEERERIAADLHDNAIQRLFAAGLSLQGMASAVPAGPQAERIARSIADIDETISEIRSTIYRMRAPLGPGSSLRDRVVQVLGELAPSLGHEPVSRFTGPIDVMVTEEIVDDVIAVLRESLIGIAQHAGADTTGISVEYVTDRRALHVAVTDNGAAWGQSARESGLAGIRARAEQRGGQFTVESSIDHQFGQGTRLQWSIPIK